MRVAAVADVEGRLVSIAPAYVEAGPVDGDGPVVRARIIPQDGQQVHELDVEDSLLKDPERLSRLHETDRIAEGRLIPVRGGDEVASSS